MASELGGDLFEKLLEEENLNPIIAEKLLGIILNTIRDKGKDTEQNEMSKV